MKPWILHARLELYNDMAVQSGGLFSWQLLGSLVLVPTSFNAIRSWLATAWLYEHSSDFSVMNWPPRSPELNPIDHLLYVLEKGVKAHHTTPATLTELWTALADVWQAIPVERFRQLVEAMTRRMAAVFKAITGPTRY
ncbi:hypothetical protein AVEN_24250-1 [Araneus ventricosus]|uniref:Tc1-like transposase DDE domain-containing protein n=1 Tax=Araneus ventricosus TaxID=182803 RepID=A0A4Y2ASE8_ARAVE|nr:hypothetical protein AVEN_24250-1 [Araneus ventricosus]